MQIGFRAMVFTAVVSMIFTTAAAGQSELRTPDGQPDLQGVWDFRTMTPLQRPEDQERAFLSEEEAAAAEAAANARRAALLEPSEIRTELLPAGGTGAERGRRVGGYNDFWLDYGTNVIEDRRTSLIIDPTDGRLPALTAEVSACVRSARSPRICRSRVRCAFGAPAPAPTTPRTAVSPSAACWVSTAARR